jgi:hypothetical protein
MCAIQAAALRNPNAKIQVYRCKARFENLIIRNEYKNIEVIQLDSDSLVKDTPIEEWWSVNKSKVLNSPFRSVHLSDLMRVVLLYKFGGVISDLGTITMVVVCG